MTGIASPSIDARLVNRMKLSPNIKRIPIFGLSIATFGFYGSKGPFWSMPPMFMTGTAAAASIAWINSIGNLGGFFGPWYVGVIKDLTDSYAGGLYGLAFLCVISAVVCALFLDIPDPAAAERRLAAAE